MDERANGWWSDPGLGRVWRAIAERLERGGLNAAGKVGVERLTREERRAVSGLLGYDVLRASVRISLKDLDERLRVRAHLGIVEAAELVVGRRLVDRPTRKVQRAEHRESASRAARAAWERDPVVPWSTVAEWLDGLRRDGILTRERDPELMVMNAFAVLGNRRHFVGGVTRPEAADGRAPVARTQLAARLFGDAHGLDVDRRLASVVLRLVALLDGPVGMEAVEPPSRRQLWERIGILSDRVSSTCLVSGLQEVGPAGRAVHLTWHDLDRGVRFTPGRTVLVCENPRVLEAGLDAPEGVSIVCTSGRAALVSIEVLRRLAAVDTRLLYHGDFDWSGVAMANDLIRRVGVEPWQMSAADYQGLPAQLPLDGVSTAALWDAELAPAMLFRGLAVHEEAALPGLLEQFRAELL